MGSAVCSSIETCFVFLARCKYAVKVADGQYAETSFHLRLQSRSQRLGGLACQHEGQASQRLTHVCNHVLCTLEFVAKLHSSLPAFHHMFLLSLIWLLPEMSQAKSSK